MVIVILLMAVWTPYVVMRLLRAQHARALSPTNPQLARTELPTGTRTGTASQDQPGWTALDERQLTRLLTNSAPRTPPNRTQA
jgi:hypothetical protein